MEWITTKYFAETVPQNAKSATAEIGSGDNGKVTITVDEVGTGGNDYTVEVVVADGNNKPLAATLTGTALVVTLGTDGSGDPDATKNTAGLIATKINTIDGLTATKSGEGTTAFTEAIAEKEFAGGQWGTPAPAGGMIYVDDANNTLYFSIASNGKSDANWRSLSLTTP